MDSMYDFNFAELVMDGFDSVLGFNYYTQFFR